MDNTDRIGFLEDEARLCAEGISISFRLLGDHVFIATKLNENQRLDDVLTCITVIQREAKQIETEIARLRKAQDKVKNLRETGTY